MPPKRRPPAAAKSPKENPARQSALAKEHSITAATENEIKEAFTLFAAPGPEKEKSLPTPSLRRALTALGVPPSSPAELQDLLDAADPDDAGSISYAHFVAVAALKLNSRSEESQDQEVEDAFQLFLAHGGRGRGQGVERITMETLRRVAEVLKQDVNEDVLRDMVLEANGGAGAGKGVGRSEFEGVMRRAGVFR